MTLGELTEKPYPYLRGEGVHIHFDMYRGDFCDAKDVEKVIERLYEHIDRLTEAYEEGEK